MSNIYIQEPPTHGKVLLKTSVGEIDIELWSKEAPKACRNFIQLCLEGYYNGTIFHRVVKGFIVQGGDPTGTGTGGESIYGEPFKDEFHSRLRFVRRGLVAMANGGQRDDNGSQFFFTLAASPELQNKHTIFGKITGHTLYNMLKLEDAIVDQNERPLYPQKIISVEVLNNPFPDIVPRNLGRNKDDDEKKKKVDESKMKGKKDFKLLSFGDEAEEEEEEINQVSKEFRGKSKSSHDLLKNDPKLSSVPAVDKSELTNKRRDRDYSDSDDEDENRSKREKLDKIKKKLNRSDDREEGDVSKRTDKVEKEEDAYFDDMDEKKKEKEKQLAEVRQQFKELKKQMLADRKKKEEKPVEEKPPENDAVAQFRKEAEKYKEASKQMPKKGSNREELALALLAKFKSRLLTARETSVEGASDEAVVGRDKDDSWLAHELRCQKEEETPIVAKDANLRNQEEWYDIYDPRNPINIRRREAGLITVSDDSKKKRSQ